MKIQIYRNVPFYLWPLTILLVPFLAMQFSDEVNWSFGDFLIAGILLMVTAGILNYSRQNIKNTNLKTFMLVMTIAVFVLVWMELAVGIIGTPFGGN